VVFVRRTLSPLAKSRVWLLALLFAAALAGCAGRMVACPQPAMQVPTKVWVDAGPGPDDRMLADKVRKLLEVRVGCDHADHDPVTGQARWSYWVELRSKQPEDSVPRYDVHLTQLDRKLTNYLDRRFREDTPGISVQRVYLDTLRADLRVRPGPAISFPCAEQVGGPSRAAGRDRSGVYSVYKVYTGDVMFKDGDGSSVVFVPIRVGFEVDFVLPAPGTVLPTDEGRERTRRRLDWAGVSDRCETCRPLLVCESLSRPVILRPPFAAPVFDATKVAEVHLVAGLERRPVTVDPSLAPRKRTVACIRWTPIDAVNAMEAAIDFQADSSDEGLSPAAPYLTFHHAVAVAELKRRAPGPWQVELSLGEILDAWEDLVPSEAPTDGQAKARQQKLAQSCAESKPAFRQTIKLR
jgi:hypothetical protein